MEWCILNCSYWNIFQNSLLAAIEFCRNVANDSKLIFNRLIEGRYFFCIDFQSKMHKNCRRVFVWIRISPLYKKIILTSKHFVHFLCTAQLNSCMLGILNWLFHGSFLCSKMVKKTVSDRNKGNIIKLSTMTRKKNSQDNLLGNWD